MTATVQPAYITIVTGTQHEANMIRLFDLLTDAYLLACEEHNDGPGGGNDLQVLSVMTDAGNAMARVGRRLVDMGVLDSSKFYHLTGLDITT